MSNRIQAGVALMLLLGACGKGDEAAAGKQTPAPAAARAKWPKESCTILSPDGVAAIVGKHVRPRDQPSICDYLTGDDNPINVSYYNNEYGGGEFLVFKGLQDERGGKSTPVSGLGTEAIEGDSGLGPGLAVQMADGRSFMVGGGDAAQRSAVARLVLARP